MIHFPNEKPEPQTAVARLDTASEQQGQDLTPGTGVPTAAP